MAGWVFRIITIFTVTLFQTVMAKGSLWAGGVTSGSMKCSSVSLIYSYVLGHMWMQLTLPWVEHVSSRLLRTLVTMCQIIQSGMPGDSNLDAMRPLLNWVYLLFHRINETSLVCHLWTVPLQWETFCVITRIYGKQKVSFSKNLHHKR